jgi:uncharacterized membrane protein
VLYTGAIILVAAVAEHIELGTLTDEQQTRLLHWCGSVQRAFLSLLDAITDSWMSYYDSLSPVGSVYQGFFLVLVMFVQIALVNILLAMFMDKVMNHLESDKDTRWTKHAEEEAAVLKDIRALLREYDNGNNRLEPNEWGEIVASGKLMNYLHSLGLRPMDADNLFHQCASLSENEAVDIDLFVDVCMSLKGTASRFEVHQLLLAIREFRSGVELAQGLEHCKGPPGLHHVLSENQATKYARQALMKKKSTKKLIQGIDLLDRLKSSIGLGRMRGAS